MQSSASPSAIGAMQILVDRQHHQNAQPSTRHRREVPGKPNAMDRLELKCRQERTRRDKMKSSIMQLKSILRDSVQMSHDQFAKLENADILELVLHQLKGDITRGSAKPTRNAHSVEALHETAYFNAGMELCATETMQFLQQVGDTSADNASGSCGPAAAKSPTKTEDMEMLMVENDAPTVNEDHAVLDLRINGSPSQNSIADAPKARRQNSPPARRDVLEKIRRKIFEKRSHQHQQRMQLQQQQQQRQEERHYLDDGYDSDEALMWRPW